MESQLSLIKSAVAGLGSMLLLAGATAAQAANANKPNILFIVLDDVGVDQFRSFGYGGVDAPKLPMLDSLAEAGVKFRNNWTMPSCSTTRATFYTGRYPFRTNVVNAILSEDLANSQVSPYEALTPQLLKKAGYKSAVIGKMHLTGTDLAPQNLPYGNSTMKKLGFDFFAGWLDGAPYPIDTTAGGYAPSGTYSCGFVPSSVSKQGACRHSDNQCDQIDYDANGTPGFDCMASGGIFEPNGVCSSQPSFTPNFDVQNAYYSGKLIVNDGDKVEAPPVSNPIARQYRSIIETNYARDFIKAQPKGQKWMVSLGYSVAHAPLQQAPRSLLAPDAPNAEAFDCTKDEDQRIIMNQSLEATDKEIRRLLLETGLAEPSGDGVRMKSDSNTYVIVVGDNGTYGPTVKPPFNPDRAKGTVYQAGVWTPLIIAGPGVVMPNRNVDAMVNSADLYQLFAEIAKVPVPPNVPNSRVVDGKTMMRYLKQANARPVRDTNYTYMGTNDHAPGTVISPCYLPKLNICAQIFTSEELCADEGGEWFGPNGVAGAEGYTSCCQVQAYEAEQNPSAAPVTILPDTQEAIRNTTYKLVALSGPQCSNGVKVGETTTHEFYTVDQNAPVPKQDNAESNLLLRPLSPVDQQNYNALNKQLTALDNSVQSCPGDGNKDGVVNKTDITNYNTFSQLNGGQSSWYDLNLDGLTNQNDMQIIVSNLGRRCPRGTE